MIWYFGVNAGDPFTLFVFSNKAFEDIPNGKKMALISNTEKLRSLMRSYLVPGTYYKNGFSTGTLKAIDNSVVQTVVDGTSNYLIPSYSSRVELE